MQETFEKCVTFVAVRRCTSMGDPRTLNIAVLIVEDEPLIRMGAVSLLEDAGFAVHEAGRADAAIRILELHKEIRLIFTDINMPGSMDGLKLAHYVRGRWPPVKIIVTSGHVRVSEDSLPAGAVFLPKLSRRHNPQRKRADSSLRDAGLLQRLSKCEACFLDPRRYGRAQSRTRLEARPQPCGFGFASLCPCRT
jgi:two-component system, response regulator PdtaR